MNAQGIESERLALGFARLMEELWAADSEQSTLLSVVKAATTVSGATAAGVLLRRARGRFETPAATAGFVSEVDRAQYTLHEGPCVASAGDNEVTLANDLTRDTRWPRFAPAATKLGVVEAMVSFRLSARGQVIGALNLYADRPFAFTDQSCTVGSIFAAHASVAIAAARRAETLTEALRNRTEISEAVGIVMERHRLTSEEAFDVLRRISQYRNIKLREVAHRIIYSGEVPGARG
jgi:GAF domain-containing protein